MKKLLAIMLSAALSLSLAACGGSEGESQYYKLGDTVTTDIAEFTLDTAQFTIALSNINDETYFTPKEFDAQLDAGNPYVAPTGHTYASFTYTVTNLDRASMEFHGDSSISVEYDGKMYSTMVDGAYCVDKDRNILTRRYKAFCIQSLL
ncbi:hypothetical protein [Evtepia gabavorous]|uniref:hypothetical protein n=1 Tax=Evtepia gabavorous TaxID=2211183 RepID=UPI003A91E40C